MLRLGIDLKKIDMVVVSHAHYDHLNGIDYLLTINPNVKIYFPDDIFWGAQTVFNGADVTSKPPRTQLWALLYAQVKRADDKVFRNILLDDQLFVRQRAGRTASGAQLIDINTDAVQYGITGWKNKDINAMLLQMGLPVDSSLSVLVVEMLPTYDKFASPFQRGNATTFSSESEMYSRNSFRDGNEAAMHQGMQVQHFKTQIRDASLAAERRQLEIETDLHSRMEEAYINQAQKEEMIRPLTEQLGSERILRTSTLVAVPPVCCTE
ncbi:MAG: MBL fold metallo-hydrolase [Pedobacter sp.]|nr:MAG: MBL fold metallo-hydrolase [Pedobacter sp.]